MSWLPLAAVSVGLCALRLAPIVYLCPVFGGVAVPSTVRVICVLSLAVAIHLSGVHADDLIGSGAELAGAAVSELLAGVAIGWIASLPFEGARLGGKLADLLRGTSAEVALPGAGSSDAATAECFHRLAVALAMTGLAWPRIVATLWRSFAWVPLGQLKLGSDAVFGLPVLLTQMVTVGLALSAPVLAVTLGVEAVVALAGRVVPSIPLGELTAPARILSGSAVIWLGFGLIADRIQGALAVGNVTLESFLKVAH